MSTSVPALTRFGLSPFHCSYLKAFWKRTGERVEPGHGRYRSTTTLGGVYEPELGGRGDEPQV